MTSKPNNIELISAVQSEGLSWSGSTSSIVYDESAIQEMLLDLEQPVFLLQYDNRIGASNSGKIDPNGDTPLLGVANPLTADKLGDPHFKQDYQSRYASYAGSMAHGISSPEMVVTLGKNGYLASYGAGGVIPAQLEETIQYLQKELPAGPYAFNLIHNPFFEALEKNAVDLYLKHRIRTVEASAYMELTPYVVYYRAAGLEQGQNGNIRINNRIIAKISRREVATKFMEPAPEKFLSRLVEQQLITQDQANMAGKVPMADDITVEADSGGHTDNRPLVSLLPSMIALRNEIQDKYGYQLPARVGAAGGIATPESALAAYMMGAAYVVTGSVNQGCIEAGTSDHVRSLLAQAQMADVAMAPAFDMFEMGGKLQVLRRGTLFAMRAQKLGELYRNCSSIDDIPAIERDKLEKQVFQKSLDQVWQETIDYFKERDPEQIAKADSNPKKKMALVFRWYLGLASHWANSGLKGREMDYQIFCGPAMGAFNDWVRGSFLEKAENRGVVAVTRNILNGTAYLYRLQQLKLKGIVFPAVFDRFIPRP